MVYTVRWKMNDYYTPLHNLVLEALCKINLTSYETRVLFAIWRMTYGFVDKNTGKRKKFDFISTSQMAIITHLDKRHVSRALHGLKTKSVIYRDDKKTSFSKQFMKLLSSREMTNGKSTVVKVSPLQMTGIPSIDDKVSPVEAPQIERRERIHKKEDILCMEMQSILFLSENKEKLKTKFPFVDVDLEIEKMIDWRRNNKKRIIDYMAFARNWLRNSKPTHQEVLVI